MSLGGRAMKPCRVKTAEQKCIDGLMIGSRLSLRRTAMLLMAAGRNFGESE